MLWRPQKPTKQSSFKSGRGGAPLASCPLLSRALDYVSLTNAAIAELMPEGLLEETLACFTAALSQAPSGGGLTERERDLRDLVLENARVMNATLAPPRAAFSRRLLHALDPKPPWPSLHAPLPPRPRQTRRFTGATARSLRRSARTWWPYLRAAAPCLRAT